MPNESYYKKNPEKYRKYTREYSAKRRLDPEVRKQRNEHARIKRLEHYGITEFEYCEILENQGGVCAICERPPSGRRLDIDHEHQRNEKKASPESRKKRIRGLLCHRCNRALGLFGNKLEILMIAADNFSKYIEKYYSKRILISDPDAFIKMQNVIKYLKDYETRRGEIT